MFRVEVKDGRDRRKSTLSLLIDSKDVKVSLFSILKTISISILQSSQQFLM